jgi:hypothetical protein
MEQNNRDTLYSVGVAVLIAYSCKQHIPTTELGKISDNNEVFLVWLRMI